MCERGASGDGAFVFDRRLARIERSRDLSAPAEARRRSRARRQPRKSSSLLYGLLMDKPALSPEKMNKVLHSSELSSDVSLRVTVFRK